MLSEAKHLWSLLRTNTSKDHLEILREACPERSRRAQNDMSPRSSFTAFLLLLLAATVFACTSPAKAESRPNRMPTPAVLQSDAPKQGLDFVVGAHGLDSLSFNGQSLLVSPETGELRPQKSVFRAALDALVPRSSSPSATPNKNTDTIDLSYPWGRISCAYGKQDDRLTIRLEVSNTSSEPLGEFSL